MTGGILKYASVRTGVLECTRQCLLESFGGYWSPSPGVGWSGYRYEVPGIRYHRIMGNTGGGEIRWGRGLWGVGEVNSF